MIAARVAGVPVSETVIDEHEARLRGTVSAALPQPGTSAGRQLRRWLTQLIVTERVVAVEAARLGVSAAHAPAVEAVLPDTAARHEVGSIAAAALADPLARALFDRVTGQVRISALAVADYHARNPMRFAPVRTDTQGWQVRAAAPPLDLVRAEVTAHLLAAARRTEFRRWLDERRARLVELAPGYEHPGDPRQPDHTHRH